MKLTSYTVYGHRVSTLPGLAHKSETRTLCLRCIEKKTCARLRQVRALEKAIHVELPVFACPRPVFDTGGR